MHSEQLIRAFVSVLNAANTVIGFGSVGLVVIWPSLLTLFATALLLGTSFVFMLLLDPRRYCKHSSEHDGSEISEPTCR